MAKKSSETPLMKQYNQIKSRYPDALLLFRVGDFYETFGEDAVKASKILGIVLTKRANGSASHIELAGFPHHSLDTYLPKLVRAGQRVAICDQLEDPKATKKIVKRGVTELVTPGVTTNDQVLQAKSNNFLCAVCLGEDRHGVSFCDISTGEFLLAEGNTDYIDKLLQSLRPSEILFSKSSRKEFESLFGNSYYSFSLDDWVYKLDFAEELLRDHFKTQNLKGFGVQGMNQGIIAAGAVFHYLRETQNNRLAHITHISRIDRDEFVWMDKFTVRNLEIFNSYSADGTSLFDVIDHTHSPMGGRLLKRWLVMPLKSVSRIKERQDGVEEFLKHPELAVNVAERLENIYDLERLVAKLSTRKINPKELQHLYRALTYANEIKHLSSGKKYPALSSVVDKINPCEKLIERIGQTLCEEPSVQIGKGRVIREGISGELDELRGLLTSGKDQLLAIQQREGERTGIPSLKIAFNNVFGYYLEVRNTHKGKVPESWVRKQTLVNAERYITEELKEYEHKILGAEDKIFLLKSQLYQDLVEYRSEYLALIQQNAQVLAGIDCLSAFASLARQHNYNRPQLDDSYLINIEEGRHPVIERKLPLGEEYISNSIHLDREEQQILMITGPNMSGKSALLRQTALICILAQVGCYVPAKAARMGIIDKIFVRVGASDNISQGESTFMVEMNETASILNNLSERSLVLLDEIGRGTSTYDGISIAWSIAEFLHEHPGRAKTLFATHYHELNEMEEIFERVRNYNVSVKEVDNSIIFMRKLKPGGSQHSFGIHVAQMAGMPNLVVNRANQMLKKLEASRKQDGEKVITAGDEMQLSFFKLDDPILESIREDVKNLDINTLTPVEALMKLNEIKRKIGD
ncbi:MAG TPA: DNA mismatch repair protein MutS [Cryomorphaceae bacterium]|nr:DNA mismatch repair protein MutS [Cryomorphaceae bacterium]